MRPSLAPWEELPTTPVRSCTPLPDAMPSDVAPSDVAPSDVAPSDVAPSDVALSEVELSNTELNRPVSLPTSIRQSRRSKAALFSWDGKIKQVSLTPDQSQEDDHAPNLAVLDMQMIRPSSATTDHGRQRFMVLAKSMKMRLPHKPQESVQHLSAQIAAAEGESIAPRHKFDTAYVEGTFDRIEYGLFRSRPAVFICIDMTLKYQPTNIIQATELKFRFGKDNTQSSSSSNSAQNPATPPTSLVSNFFAPDELQGIPASSHITKHSHIKPKLAALSFHADLGGSGKKIAKTEQHRWHVQGRVDEQDGGIRDTFSWSIFQNDISNDSVPRRVRLGMIAFHERKPFYVDVSVDGSIRKGKHLLPRPTQPTQEKRWFYPPRFQSVGEHVLDEERLQDHIRQQNNGILDVVPNRAMECLRGGDQIQMMNNRMRSGGVGQGIAGAAGDTFSLLDTAAGDTFSLLGMDS